MMTEEMTRVLRELHQPRVRRAGRGGTATTCAYDNNRWPCPEIRLLDDHSCGKIDCCVRTLLGE